MHKCLTSFARMPPILLKVGIWMPYLSSSLRIALISSSEIDTISNVNSDLGF